MDSLDTLPRTKSIHTCDITRKLIERPGGLHITHEGRPVLVRGVRETPTTASDLKGQRFDLIVQDMETSENRMVTGLARRAVIEWLD